MLRKEIPGNATGRIAVAVWRECIRLVLDGVLDVRDVDALMSSGLAARWAAAGPFQTAYLEAGERQTAQLSAILRALESRWEGDTGFQLPPNEHQQLIRLIERAYDGEGDVLKGARDETAGRAEENRGLLTLEGMLEAEIEEQRVFVWTPAPARWCRQLRERSAALPVDRRPTECRGLATRSGPATAAPVAANDPGIIQNRLHSKLNEGRNSQTTLAPRLKLWVVAFSPSGLRADGVSVAPAFQWVTIALLSTRVTGRFTWNPTAPPPRPSFSSPVGSRYSDGGQRPPAPRGCRQADTGSSRPRRPTRCRIP